MHKSGAKRRLEPSLSQNQTLRNPSRPGSHAMDRLRRFL